MEKEKRKKVLISLHPSLHESAQKRADKLGLSFSAYLRLLLHSEVEVSKKGI